MADIILVNNQDQDEVLSGVSKLVTRGTSGNVEFSIGGGGSPSSIITNIYTPQTNVNVSIFGVSFTLTGSPMTIQLYVDVPKNADIVSWRPLGDIFLYSGSGENRIGRIVSIEDNDWVLTEADEITSRYATEETFSYADEKYGQIHGHAYFLVSFKYDGVVISVQNGESILSGPNAAKFMSSPLFLGDNKPLGKGATQQFDVYDMRQDTAENVALNVMSYLDVPRAVYLPAGISSIPDYCFYQMRNLELIDFSLATSVPTLGGAYTFQGLKSGFQIVVPSALYEEWKAAKNWSNVADHIVAV